MVTSAFRPAGGLRGVLFGPGCVRASLAAELADQHVRRPMVVCGAQVARSAALATVLDALGAPGRRAALAVFDGSRPHTPAATVERGASAARDHGADALLAVGGSSAVDTAKGIAVLVTTGARRLAELAPANFGHLDAAPTRRPDRVMPLVAVTTTLSFAEMLPFWGARNPAEARKVPYGDHVAVVRTVLLDGEVAAGTPRATWYQTGVKAIDDAVAAYCRSRGPEPLADPLLVSALATLTVRLAEPDGAPEAEVMERRQEILAATWATKLALPRVAPAAVGGWFSTAVRQAELAAALGAPGGAGAEGLPALVDDLVARLGVPRTLAGVAGRDRIDEVVARMAEEAPDLGGVEAVRPAVAALW